jgi:hypothetical protein
VFPTYDLGSQISAPTTGSVGQMIYVWLSIASFQRDPKTKQPNVEIEFVIVDEKGQPTLDKPIKRIQDNNIEADKGAFPVYFPLYMNRPGTFTLKITATDKVANKKATYDLPVTVLPVK